MDNRSLLSKRMVIASHEIPGIGWHTIDKLVKQRFWERPKWTLHDLIAAGLREFQAKAAIERFKDCDWYNIEEQPDLLGPIGAARLTPYDAEYPELLRQIAQPPWVLYVKGRIELLQRQAIAVVGTRVPTAYGRHTAERMAKELSEAGVTVVSGLAKGIDRIAHEAALSGEGSTIAVLPTPINACYPAQHESLFQRIAEQGLLISENPIGSTLHPGQFYQRNRIIAALSRATIVVEGAMQSGSLITADHATEMNRELFAVPGPISSPKSEGPNELIRKGRAFLISSIDQIFEELNWLKSSIDASKQTTGYNSLTGNKVDQELPANEQKIVELLQDRAMSIEDIHELSAIPFGQLNGLLLNLCIKRKIELQPGSIYVVL